MACGEVVGQPPQQPRIATQQRAQLALAVGFWKDVLRAKV